MFTFIHLSNEQRKESRRAEFSFLCIHFSRLQSASSPVLRLGVSNCEWREKIEMCEGKNIRFQLFSGIKDASDEEWQKGSPWKLSRYKATLFTRYIESFPLGRGATLVEIEASSLWDKNVFRFWVRINFFWCFRNFLRCYLKSCCFEEISPWKTESCHERVTSI